MVFTVPLLSMATSCVDENNISHKSTAFLGVGQFFSCCSPFNCNLLLIVVQTTTGEIVERRLGDKQVLIQAAAGGGTRKIEAGPSPARTCLSDEQIRALAALGARVEALFETPQDIEWAIDASGQIFLLQARPITTLFPLPARAPSPAEHLSVYLAFGVQQGTYRPFTPLVLSALQCLSSGFLALIGSPLRDP